MEEKFRISDIFKKSKQGRRRPTRGIRFTQTKPEVKPEEVNKTKPEEEPSDKTSQPPVIDKALGREHDVGDSTLYSEAVLLARRLYNLQADKTNIASGVYASVKVMVDLISAEDKGLLRIALADYPIPNDYIYYHVVNVCIISLHLGVGLGYNPVRLNELGAAAFFHDIGISKYLDIINRPKRLNLQELSEVKQHPVIGPQMLGKISESLNESIFEVIRQEHERLDGSGYPEGLEEDEIIEYAQVVGLSDVYEALLHLRPYRAKYTSLEVIKMLLENKYSFAHRLIKVLIERIGIFPTGTFVMLNTREVAEVLKGNIDSPLRPIVNIIFDVTGKRLKDSRQINLADNPTVYISGVSSTPS